MENINNNEQEQLIIPTQNITFAVLKDGSFYNGTSKEEPAEFLRIFQALKKFIRQASREQIAAFSLSYLIEGRDLGDTIIKRVEEVSNANKE